MGRVERSVEIKAPPEKVWEMLAFDRLPEWDEGWVFGERVEYTSEVNTSKDKYRVGATARGIPEKQGDVCCNFEVVESLENEKIKYRAWEETKYFGILTALTTYTLEPVGTDTKFTYELESEWRGFWGFFGKLAEILFARRSAEKQIQKVLQNLKNILEK